MAFDNLVVVQLPVATNDIRWEGKDQWFHAESCARHLLVGVAAQLDSLPENIRKNSQRHTEISTSCDALDSQKTMILRGQDAYEFLLRFACGLESKNSGEYYVLQDLRADWKRHQQQHPQDDNVKRLMKPMEHLLADARLVRDHVYSENLRPTRYENSASAAAGIKGGEHVLLIADSKDITKRAARALGCKNSHSAGRLTVTHPNAFALKDRMGELTKLQEGKFINCPMDDVPFEQAMTTEYMSKVDHVVVCTPMLGKLESNQRAIIDAWRKLPVHKGHLVVLQGNPSEGHATTDLWKEAALPNCLLPEAIHSRFKEDVAHNRRVLGEVASTCHQITLARKCGLTTGRMERIVKDTECKDPVQFQQSIESLLDHQGWTRTVEGQRGAHVGTEWEQFRSPSARSFGRP